MYGPFGQSSENVAETPPKKAKESALGTPIKDGEAQSSQYINVGAKFPHVNRDMCRPRCQFFNEIWNRAPKGVRNSPLKE